MDSPDVSDCYYIDNPAETMLPRPFCMPMNSSSGIVSSGKLMGGQKRMRTPLGGQDPNVGGWLRLPLSAQAQPNESQ